MLPAIDIACPYCGEWITVFVEDSAGDQDYIEDCQVCCHPIRILVSLDDDGQARVDARAENDV